MSPVEEFLRALGVIHGSGAGVAETSYYGPIENLLNAVGRGRRPRVHCIVHPKNAGAGIPDGGLFTADQLKGQPGGEFPSLLPARGAIEVKPASDDLASVVRTEQVARYVKRYGQLLLTNLRVFALIEPDAAGKPRIAERYILADDEAAFWSAVGQAPATLATHGASLVDFLQRVMLHAAPLENPADLAGLLAAYAREARARIEGGDATALASLRAALEASLGLTFEGDRGNHFLRSTLVQTLFYGIFSAWVIWSKRQRPGNVSAHFDWRTAQFELSLGVIGALFEQMAIASTLKALGLIEVLHWAGAALNRVNRDAFSAHFEEEQAIQDFYEPFLEAFDPRLRKQLGVWYTPLEIVRYMVTRADTVLRQEMGIADGLADPHVYVLDPCCGTGTYLVEMVRQIAETMRARGGDALLAADLKQAVLTRLFGFEILPAPFVIAHLQLGLLLQNLGVPLADDGRERVGVYLTNALTGWQPGDSPTQLLLPELERERDAAAHIKRDVDILVILGNPPYFGFAGVTAAEEERSLSTAYRSTKSAPAPAGQGLNDPYVRFFRMAERRIVEQTGRGIVCFISNYSWLDSDSFTGMRERYLDVFDHIWIDCLNGDKYKTGKLTPSGTPDPSVFSTNFNPEGIQVGTAITLLVRTAAHQGANAVRFRHLWGRTKRDDLLSTSVQDGVSLYQTIQPPLALGLPFLPAQQVDPGYLKWPRLADLFPISFPGVKTSRDDLVVDINRDRLTQRMEQYFDLTISNAEMRQIAPGAMQSTARFKAEAVRDQLSRRGFQSEHIVRYCYRPYDIRWIYWEPETKLLDEKRAEYIRHGFEGNSFLFTTGRLRKSDPEPALVTARLLDLNCMDSGARGFPLYLAPAQDSLFAGSRPPTANLSQAVRDYLTAIGADERQLFFHCLSLLHAPAYLRANTDALRYDWPRLPLPASPERLEASAALGRQLAALLDPEQPVPGVTSGPIRPELRPIAVITKVGGSALNPSTDLALLVG